MFIPVGTDRQSIWVVNKDESGEVTKDKVMDVRVSFGSLDRYLAGKPQANNLAAR